MSGVKRILKLIGETVYISRPFDPDYFLPKEMKGKSIEQRAAETIAQGYQEGIRQVRKRRPELSHVQEEPARNSARA